GVGSRSARPRPAARCRWALERSVLLLHAHGERQAPSVGGLAVDREAPLVAARLERQRAGVDRDREIQRRPGLETGRAPDLDWPCVEEPARLRAVVRLHLDLDAVRVEKLEAHDVALIRLVPR